MTPAPDVVKSLGALRAKTVTPARYAVLPALSLLAAFACAGQPAMDVHNASPGARPESPAADVEITTVSSRPDMVTGGDALVRFVVPAGTPANQIRVTLNG